MKVLEILDKLKNKMLNFTSIDVENATIEIEAMQEHNRDLFLKIIELTKQRGEAIAELEEAMKPKTCKGCIRLYFDEIEKVYKCWNDVSDDVGYLHGEAVIRNIKDFCCNQFQPKDNA